MAKFFKAVLQFLIEVISGGITEMQGLKSDDLLIKSATSLQISGILQFLASLGTALTIMYFLLEINQKLAFEGSNFTLKSLLAPFLKLFAAMMLLAKADVILQNVIKVHNSVIKTLGGNTLVGSFGAASTSAVEGVVETFTKDGGLIALLIAAVTKMGMMVLIGMLLFVLLVIILTLIIKLVYWYKSLVYKVEFVWRVCLFPICLADVYAGNAQNVLRYFKSIMVLALYGAALCIVPKIAMTLALDGLFSDTSAMTAALNATPLDVVKAFSSAMQILVGVVQAFVLAPFVGLSACSLARSAAKDALQA